MIKPDFILIILGGILVLFVYIASLVSNEPFIVNNIILTIPLIIILPNIHFIEFNTPIVTKEIAPLYSSFSSTNSALAILYLLFRLLVVIFLVTHFKGPLRTFY